MSVCKFLIITTHFHNIEGRKYRVHGIKTYAFRHRYHKAKACGTSFNSEQEFMRHGKQTIVTRLHFLRV